MSEHVWVDVMRSEDVPEDGTLQVRVKGEPVCLYNIAGRIYATHDTCTHGEASLADGFIEGENIVCPFHQGQFHIPTGRAVATPCTVNLKVYEVLVQNGVVKLRS